MWRWSLIRISLIMSSIRHHLWSELIDSLKSNTIDYEVIGAGNLDNYQVRGYIKKYQNFRYIHTKNIKPAQCYQVALSAALGDLVMWIADDCEFSELCLDKVVEYYDSLDDPRAILSLRTNENNSNNALTDHRFFGNNQNTPQMAPLGVIAREYLNELGGFDRRYICGQYENDVVMRVLADGGHVYNYEDVCVSIEHSIKHGAGTNFWKGYSHDRQILEDTWVKGGYTSVPKPILTLKEGIGLEYYCPIDNREVLYKPNLPFESYDPKDLKETSQSHKGMWE